MNIKVLTLSTHPRKTTDYWQCVFIPTVSAYFSSYDGENRHVAVNFEWLFWSATLLIHSNDETVVYQFNDN